MIQDDSTLKWYLYGDVSERETETEKERQRETEREKKLILQGITFPKKNDDCHPNSVPKISC